MKSFFTTFSTVLLFSLAITVQAQDDECPDGYEAVESPPGSGNIVCEKVNIVCPGTGRRDYVDKATGQQLCCPSSKNLVILDNDRDGVCCDMSQIVEDGQCVTPTPGGGSGPQCPRQPAGACALKAACGNSTNNGLEYGSCYTLAFPDGHQLGRGRNGANNEYIEDGYVQDIPFKVCKSTTDCGTGSLANGDSFYLQDLVGDPGDATGKLGWNNAAGGTHLTMTPDPASAGQFKGKSSCSGTNCKCVVKLSGNPNGLGYACPAQQPGITFWPNQRVTLNMQFIEIPCTNADPAPQGQ
ncbi:hypothetical protein D9758_010459 [Tetrapyrgos nigripes]|uniref:Cysteine-rich secreted protein n=1 Tax=Tetrapyrgos nigripes TaxID=182062 RepID=A0A8H5CNI0_9AGAR|nr:hypothetical protein D9758_010459 [Tetrapyrgos nigripes]